MSCQLTVEILWKPRLLQPVLLPPLPLKAAMRKTNQVIKWTWQLLDSAVEAERIGLINKVVPHDSLGQTAEEMAQKLTEYNENSVKIFKKLINQGMMVDFQTGLQIEAQEFDNFLAESRKQNK